MENRIFITPETLSQYVDLHKSLGYTIFIGGTKDKPKHSLEIANNDGKDWYCYFRNFGSFVKGFDNNVREPDDFVLLRNDLKYIDEFENLYFAITGKQLKKF